MAELVKAAWLPSGSYLAREDRTVIRTLRRWEGYVDEPDFLVKATVTPSMQVTVAPGHAIIDGDQDPSAQGSYIVAPPDTKTLTHDAADPTNPRIDTVGIQVWDNDFDGSGNYTWDRLIVKGTPAPSPSVPTPPANWMPLANVTIGAGVASITQDKIQDVRNRTDHKPFNMKAHATVQTSLPSKAAAQIHLNAIDWDPANKFDGYTFYATVSGNYLVAAQVTRNPDSAGSFLEGQIWIWTPETGQWVTYAKNAAPTYNNSVFDGVVQVVWGGFLNPGSMIQLWCYSDQLFPNVTSLNNVPWMNVLLLD